MVQTTPMTEPNALNLEGTKGVGDGAAFSQLKPYFAYTLLSKCSSLVKYEISHG